MPSETARIFRLKNGEDVISVFIDGLEDNTLTLINPMTLGKMKVQGGYTLYMVPWLPIDIIKYDAATIYADEVLTVLIPTDEIVEKYDEAVLQMLERINYEPTKEEQYTEVLENFEHSNTKH